MGRPAKKYGKIPNLYRKEAQTIFSLEQVVVTEKIDGTNFSFGLVDGEPRINSRNNQVWGVKKLPAGDQEFHNLQFDGYGFVNKFKELFGLEIFETIKEKLNKNNILFYGEFYGKGIMNRVQYGDEKRFAFFDAYDLEERDWVSYDKFVAYCEALGLPMVPTLYVGPPKLSAFEQWVKIDSRQGAENGVYGNNPHEGIVIKGLYSERDRFGDRIITKFKTEKFSEIKTESKKELKKPKGSTEQLQFAENVADAYVTESRLENILEKLKGENTPVSIKITGKVIKAMQQDILEDLEEKDNKLFDERLFNKYVGASTAKLFQEYLKKEFYETIK